MHLYCNVIAIHIPSATRQKDNLIYFNLYKVNTGQVQCQVKMTVDLYNSQAYRITNFAHFIYIAGILNPGVTISNVFSLVEDKRLHLEAHEFFVVPSSFPPNINEDMVHPFVGPLNLDTEPTEGSFTVNSNNNPPSVNTFEPIRNAQQGDYTPTIPSDEHIPSTGLFRASKTGRIIKTKSSKAELRGLLKRLERYNPPSPPTPSATN